MSDFDLVDDSGVAIPSLGTGDNGRIEQEALKHLGKKAGLDWTRNPDALIGVDHIIYSAALGSGGDTARAQTLGRLLQKMSGDRVDVAPESGSDSPEVEALFACLSQRIDELAEGAATERGDNEDEHEVEDEQRACLRAFILLAGSAATGFEEHR